LGLIPYGSPVKEKGLQTVIELLGHPYPRVNQIKKYQIILKFILNFILKFTLKFILKFYIEIL